MKKSTMIASALLAFAGLTASAQTGDLDLYLAGPFNGFAPDGSSEWVLECVDEDYPMYRGTFDIPEDEFQFNIQFGMLSIVPGVYDADAEDFVPASQNESVVLDDGFYSISNFATTGVSQLVWDVTNWAGGQVEITVTLNEYDTAITISAVEEEPVLFISGEFNNYDPAGSPLWALSPDEDDPTTFIGYFEIPEGKFKVNFNFMGMSSLVPADETGEISSANVDVLVGDTFFNGPFTSTGVGNVYWVNEDWEGGLVEVMVDFSNNEVIFSVDGQVEELWYVRGEFNDYDPAGMPQYALTPSGEYGEIIKGTVSVPAGEFSLNFLSPFGFIYIPRSLQSEEITFTDGVYEGGIDYAMYEEEEAAYWTNDSWAGGDVNITIDLNESTVKFEAVPAAEEELLPYVYGAFNDYNPDGNADWALAQVVSDGEEVEGVFRGTFDVPEGQFKFNVVYGFGHLVPGIFSEADDDIVAQEMDIEVLGDDEPEFFAGPFATSGVSSVYWMNEDWEGGLVEITIDMINNEILISKVLADEPWLYLSGEFNGYSTDDVLWGLYPDPEDPENTLRGTFEIPAGKFKFNFSNGFGYVVPGEEDEDGEEIVASTEDVEVLADDTFFSGPMASVEMAGGPYWVNENWEGGSVEVTVDILNQMIILSTDEEAADAFYIRGEFNDYDPAGMPEWTLNAEAGENGVYTGIFEVPAGEFSFNVMNAQGMIFIPASEKTEEITLTNDTYTGNLVDAFDTQDDIYWTYPSWEGGEVTVTVDTNESTITIVAIGGSIEPRPNNWWLRGEFNNFEPDMNTQWALLPSDTEDFIWEGTVTIPAGKFSFNLEDPSGLLYGPEASVEIEVDGNDQYTGAMDWIVDENYTWNYADWTSDNQVTVCVNSKEETITITFPEGTSVKFNLVNGEEEVIYNLNGMKVDRNKLDKGIYIVNGKKVIF